MFSKMEDYSSLLLSLAMLTLTLAFIFIKSQRTKAKSPPGPKPWPIIGNLNLLGPTPHRSLHRLSRKYGEIMFLKFGKFPVVIASSPKMAEQFLKVHDANFASRPALAAAKHISFDSSDVSFAPHGPYWRGARKIITSELLNPKKLESSEGIRAEETCSFLSRLRDLAGEPVVLRDHLSRYTLSIVSRMVFRGKYLSESEEGEESSVDMCELRGMMKEWIVLSGAFNVGDWIPWLGFLDLQGFVKRMKRLRGRMDRFYDLVIEDHLRERGEDDCTMKAFIEVLLHIAEDPIAEIQLTRDCVKALTMNLLLGGTDTIATTIEWAIQELLRQPRIIEKAKEELDRVIGRDRWVEEDDFPRLPYVDAIIMETFRFHPLATLLTPRFAINDCRVAGYDISKGTTVLVNAWSIGRDPSLWDSPQEFLPERFMGRAIDTAASDFTLLPFGSGRRMCIGYNLGLKTLRTTLANLLHGFEMKLVEGMRPQDISMEEQYGISTKPKHPLSVIFKPTLPTQLY